MAVDLIPRVWISDERTRALRRLTSRRAQLVRAPANRNANTPTPPSLPRATTKQRAAEERQLAEQAERAYRRLIADWQATAPNNGAGTAPGRASQGPSSDQAARQAPAPEPAL